MSEWISVLDRLPTKSEIGKRFLVACYDRNWWIDISSYTGKENTEDAAWSEAFFVRYWMPLPVEPQEELRYV